MTAPFLRIVAGTHADVTRPRATAAREQCTETRGNRLARDHRRDAWQRAEALTAYWRARLDMYSAVQLAEAHNLPQARLHPHTDEEGRLGLVTLWREAKAAQLLTPAYRAPCVLWKKAHLTGQGLNYGYLPVERGQIERAIEADEAFLASHPVRQTRSAETKAHRHAFKEAMRQRVREVARLRSLHDDDFRPALSLRHRQIGEFCEAHGVSLGWLLEGEGEMFRRGPKLAVDGGQEVQP